MLKWLQMACKQCVLFDYVGMSVVIDSCFCRSHEVHPKNIPFLFMMDIQKIAKKVYTYAMIMSY